MSGPAPTDPDQRVLPARVELFGFDPADARLTVRPRARRWRMIGAVRTAAIGVVAAPLVALVPPHVPWALGALGVGGVLARRRWMERFTVEGVAGACPRCGGDLVAPAGRLRSPHPATCDACHNEVALHVDASELDRAEAA